MSYRSATIELMSPPKSMYRVSWRTATHPDRPNERVARDMHTPIESRAAYQAAMVRHWEPEFMELVGVWHTHGGSGSLDWTPVDGAELSMSEMDADRLARLTAGWQTNPWYTEMKGTEDG